jgi:hypothetical protein
LALLLRRKGKEVVRYFTEEEQVDQAAPGVAEALGLAGAWSDLDLDETLDSLERIRHEGKPTPPIEL